MAMPQYQYTKYYNKSEQPIDVTEYAIKINRTTRRSIS